MKRWFSRITAAALAAVLLTTPAFAAGSRFSDVPEHFWGYTYVERAASEGWVNGNGDGTFSPNSELNGGAVCAMLTNMLGMSGNSSPWWSGPVNTAQSLGLLENTALYDRYLQAGNQWTESAVLTPLSRYDMAMIVYNLGRAGVEGIAMPSLSSTQLSQAQSKIADYSTIPQHYRQAVLTVFAAEIVSGKDGGYHGEDNLTRAESCVFLAAIADKMGTGLSQEEQWIARVIELVNREREKEGLSPLGTYSSLQQAAQVRAAEIVSQFSHTRPDGSGFETAIQQAGAQVPGTYMCGENIAGGYTSPEAVVEGWMNSPGHRANILEPNFTHIGVGCVHLPESSYKYYWSQAFVGTSIDPNR